MSGSAKTAADTPDNETVDAPGLAQFEASLGELEGLVEALESGDISLEEALAKFERGVALTRQCQSLLKNAELRVDQLMAQQGPSIESGDNGETAERIQPLDTDIPER